MPWFRHVAMAHEDPAIVELLETMGAEGYGIYWLLIEHLANFSDDGAIPGAMNTVNRWAKICRCTPESFQQFVGCAVTEEFRLIEVEQLPRHVRISAPKLLKYIGRNGDVKSQTLSHPPKQTDNFAPHWKTDKEYKPFVDAASEAWRGLIDSDFSECYPTWRVLDFEQRNACVKSIRSRIEMKVDFEFVPRPVKYLKNREYYRPVDSIKKMASVANGNGKHRQTESMSSVMSRYRRSDAQGREQIELTRSQDEVAYLRQAYPNQVTDDETHTDS